MFSQACVKNSVHGGDGGGRAWERGRVSVAKVGTCLVNGGVHGEGVTCMVKRGRGV